MSMVFRYRTGFLLYGHKLYFHRSSLLDTKTFLLLQQHSTFFSLWEVFVLTCISLYYCIYFCILYFCICVLSKVGKGLRWRNRRIEKWLPASALHLQFATAKLHNKLRKHIRLHNHIFGQVDLRWYLQCWSKQIYIEVLHIFAMRTQHCRKRQCQCEKCPTSFAVSQTTRVFLYNSSKMEL